ncbi:MAG: LysR family transcriptional regulator [Beijerinckiaceae bacterium]|nr:LysR family transcriptional regulator [Beijerinckiaceae bacterium]
MIEFLAACRTFSRVVEAGSFTAVAREQNTTQPTISRQIAMLEAHLGCRLFHRTTRALTLTDDGHVFYDHARRMADTASEAENAVGRRKGRPSGTLRLACAAVMGRLHILPRLPKFLDAYPDVAVDVVLGDAFIDLVEERIDLAIRVGELMDPNLVARRIGTTRRRLLATPGYLARFGAPDSPADLKKHDCVIYGGLTTGATWRFSNAKATLDVQVRGRVRVNTTEGLRSAILSGVGIGVAPSWHFVDKEIETGRLVALLPDFEPSPHPIHAVYASRRFVSPAVRAMIDFLADEFARDAQLRSEPG